MAGARLNLSGAPLPNICSRLLELHIRLRIIQQLVKRQLLGKPVGLLFLRYDDRHPIMDEADAVGGLAGEDGEARQMCIRDRSYPARVPNCISGHPCFYDHPNVQIMHL